jgi:hypothetical protein
MEEVNIDLAPTRFCALMIPRNVSNYAIIIGPDDDQIFEASPSFVQLTRFDNTANRTRELQPLEIF